MSMQREYANGDDNTRAQESTGTTRFMRENLLSSRPAENRIFFHIAVDFFFLCGGALRYISRAIGMTKGSELYVYRGCVVSIARSEMGRMRMAGIPILHSVARQVDSGLMLTTITHDRESDTTGDAPRSKIIIVIDNFWYDRR